MQMTQYSLEEIYRLASRLVRESPSRSCKEAAERIQQLVAFPLQQHGIDPDDTIT